MIRAAVAQRRPSYSPVRRRQARATAEELQQDPLATGIRPARARPQRARRAAESSPGLAATARARAGAEITSQPWAASRRAASSPKWTRVRATASKLFFLDPASRETRSGLSADDLDPEELLKAKRWIAKAGWGFTLLIVVIWPVLSTPAGVFTKDYFAFWIFIAVIWALVASFIIIVLPIWESKDQILAVFDGIFHTNLCEYYNPETSKQHKLPQAASIIAHRM